MRDVAKCSKKWKLQRNIPLSQYHLPHGCFFYHEDGSSSSIWKAMDLGARLDGQLTLTLISDVFFFICPLHFHDFTTFPILLSWFLLYSSLLFLLFLLFHKEKHRSSTGLDYGVGLDLSGERTTFTVREQTAGKHRNAKRVTKRSDNVVKFAITELY